MLEVVLDFVLSWFNWIFWGICNYVFHCFRFVELFVFAIDFIVNFIHVLLEYNNTVISAVIDAVRFNTENLHSICIKQATATRTFIMNTPQKVTDFTEYIYYGIWNGIINFVSLIYATFSEFFISIPEKSANGIVNLVSLIYATFSEFFTSIPEKSVLFLRENGVRIFLLVTEVTSQILFFILKTIVNAVLYISHYAISFAEMVKRHLNYFLNPAVTVLVSSGEIIAKTSTRIFDMSITNIYNLFSTIGGWGKAIMNNLLYFPFLMFETVSKITSYIIGMMADIYNILVIMAEQLNLTEFLLGLFLTSVFILFITFLITNREISDFASTQQPVILVRLLFEKITSLFTNQLNEENDDEQNVRDLNNDAGNNFQRQNFQYEQQEHQQQTPQNDKALEMVCVVCQDSEKTVVLLPCKHLCLCVKCLDSILIMPYREHKCPLCRKKIREYINVFM